MWIENQEDRWKDYRNTNEAYLHDCTLAVKGGIAVDLVMSLIEDLI